MPSHKSQEDKDPDSTSQHDEGEYDSDVSNDDCDHNNEAFKLTTVDMHQYRINIVDRKRNLKLKKLVHDTRNKQSKVYGLADDIVISVDEINKKYFSWGICDIEDQQEYLEMCELLHRWPAANTVFLWGEMSEYTFARNCWINKGVVRGQLDSI